MDVAIKDKLEFGMMKDARLDLDYVTVCAQYCALYKSSDKIRFIRSLIYTEFKL